MGGNLALKGGLLLNTIYGMYASECMVAVKQRARGIDIE